MSFSLRMLTWYKSLSFLFVKTERAIPEENHTRPEDWLCYSMEALLQSVHAWQCRQITDRESQREGENQRKETQGDAIEVYLKSCRHHHHWELLICSNCQGWVHFETFVCHQKNWNAFGLPVIHKCGKVISFLRLLLTQWRIIAVSLGYVYRAGLCVCEWRGCEAGGEIGLSGGIIAAIKPCCCGGAHNQSCGGKLTAE